uniref:G protein-coupled receptor n=1 Tax=Steinernema glaseri TaxID=37863 RepID=A0A1I7Y534_9BILA
MLRGVAIAQFAFIVALWIATFFTIFLIFRKRPLSSLFKSSPTMSIIFVFIVILGAHQTLHYILWILFISQLWPNPGIVKVELVLGVSSISLQTAYDFFTIVLFLQRLAMIVDPIGKQQKIVNRLLYSTATLASVLVFIYLVFVYSKVIDFGTVEIAEDCYALTCTKPFQEERAALDVRTALTIANVLVGAVFTCTLLGTRVLQRAKPTKTLVKINQVTRFLFLARLFSELIPLIVDTLFVMQTGISIGYYIGAFGAIGATLEIFGFVLVYYFVFSGTTRTVPRYECIRRRTKAFFLATLISGNVQAQQYCSVEIVVMQLAVAIAEFTFLIFLWAATLLILFLIFRRRIVHTKFLGSIDTVFGVISISNQSFYDIFTIVLFIQRIAIIVDPSKNRRNLNRFLYTVATLSSSSLCLYMAIAYSKVIDFTADEVPEGCYTLTCTTPFRLERVALNARTVLSIANVLVGIVFLVIILSRKTLIKTNVAKVNGITRVLFFTKLFLEVIPLIVDSLFISQTGVSIGFYIGAFGAIGCTIEAFCFVFVYYIVFKPRGKTTSSRATTQ